MSRTLRTKDSIIGVGLLAYAMFSAFRPRAIPPVSGFGLWDFNGENGLEYQNRLRAEWPD